MLDTNVAIHLRDGDPQVIDRIEALDDDVSLSIVTRVELEGGILRDPARAEVRRVRLESMLRTLPTVPFDDTAADAYREILNVVGFSRRKVLDRMIAAQALVRRATLVTLNADDFRDVPGLSLLEW
jgi:predicted nucleic acid-binding protein